MNVRVLAWRVLRAQHVAPLRLARAVARQAQLSSKDRRLLAALVEHCVRRQTTLRALARAFSLGNADADTAPHIAIGLTQAFLMERLPDDVVVKETLRAARLTLGERPGRVVERALRAAYATHRRGHRDDPTRDLVLRDVSFDRPVFADPREHPLLWAEEALAVPVPLLKRWVRRYGEAEAQRLARGALEAADVSLVAPEGRREELLAELAAAGIAARPGAHARIVLVLRKHAESLRRSACVREGRLVRGGETALRARELLLPAPAGAPASPGSPGPDGAPLEFAADTPPGTRHASVFVAVPSSNTGVLARRPSSKWRFSSERQAQLGARQIQLLARGAECVLPGGQLVYATHSIEPEENQRRIQAFLAAQPEFTLEAEHAALPDERSTAGPMDGGYAARLRRRA